MVTSLAFDVQGSATEPYRVEFIRRSDQNLTASCTCGAGIVGQYCKHRFAILEGDASDIVSPNADDVSVVASWLKGTDIEAAMIKVQELEKDALRIKKEISNAKQEVARAMRD